MKYIKITRSDVDGNYTIPKELLCSTIDAEFDDIDYQEIGTQIIFTIVEMEESEYDKLPEFQGW